MAASVVAAFYVAVTVPLDIIDSNHLVAQVDGRVSERLKDIARRPLPEVTRLGAFPTDRDVDDAPVVIWRVDAGGHVTALTSGAPALPASAWPRDGHPATAELSTGAFRLEAARVGADWLVAGQSLQAAQHVEAVVQDVEVAAGPLFVLVTFFAAVAIGVMASRPVELVRRRQLEFTADASHELRTPLTVIEAEVGLALSSPRTPLAYREALQRIGTEGRRLRRIVEDLLFLARFDSGPPAPLEEPVDIAVLASAAAERFSAVAQAAGIDLCVEVADEDVALVAAPAAWLDRLCGVLVDNACKYAGENGTVRVMVRSLGSTVFLVVEDSGPGIAPDQRPLLFDRFHRGTAEGEGAGLGLAIADAVVSSSAGRWRVGNSTLGGARMEVSWRRAQVHEAEGLAASPWPSVAARARPNQSACTRLRSPSCSGRRPGDERNE
ncbi:MAG TPA: HAMP domain-containing sensor histidine kinase [Acidimicrobiales bacterium]|nr:HAMP domain-containing sensor histidine kinase [Acidimicrobiales bacterium]